MANKIISDSFEILGGAVKQIGDDIAENVGLKTPPDTGTSEQGGQPQQQTPQKTKEDKAEKKKTATRYRQLQEEIRQIQLKRSQEMVKYSQPGLTDEEKQEKQIQQLEEKSEDKLPPLPVQRVSRKTESMRGTSG